VENPYSGTRHLFSLEDLDRILKAGAFELPLHAADPGPPRPAHINSDEVEFASFLEVIAGSYIENVETKFDRQLARELKKLLTGTARLRRNIGEKSLTEFLAKAHRRVEFAFIPKAERDAHYLGLLEQLRSADVALEELERRTLEVANLKRHRATQILVVLLAIVWQKWKGNWPGVSVDPSSQRVHGPFVRFVHGVVEPLRREFPALPQPAAATIRSIVRRSALRPMAMPVKKQSREAILREH
jgi:hypothetical protein